MNDLRVADAKCPAGISVSRSMFGVRTLGFPDSPQSSQAMSSAMNSTMLGRVGVSAATADVKITQRNSATENNPSHDPGKCLHPRSTFRNPVGLDLRSSIIPRGPIRRLTRGVMLAALSRHRVETSMDVPVLFTVAGDLGLRRVSDAIKPARLGGARGVCVGETDQEAAQP